MSGRVDGQTDERAGGQVDEVNNGMSRQKLIASGSKKGMKRHKGGVCAGREEM